jgi:hypothetical protein
MMVRKLALAAVDWNNISRARARALRRRAAQHGRRVSARRRGSKTWWRSLQLEEGCDEVGIRSTVGAYQCVSLKGGLAFCHRVRSRPHKIVETDVQLRHGASTAPAESRSSVDHELMSSIEQAI